ncbi:MAG: glycoside hydrolase family 97 protein [Bacteroidaceae bacterium]|nr:glycoside hydrolase family 97 protein [Bacteroidaceae bacterium]
MKKLFSLAVIAFMTVLTVSAQKTATLSSPSGEIKANVSIEEQKLYYSVEFNGKEILSKMPLAMTFSNGVVAGEKVKSLKPKTKTVEEVFAPTIAVRNSKVNMKYNESEFKFGKYSVIFRLYDDAVAYRFVTRFGKKEINVIDETVAYNFANDNKILFPEEGSMYTHQERKFIDTTVGAIAEKKFASHPMLATDNGVRMIITEVDLESYPGVYYQKVPGNSFKGIFPAYALETEKRSDRDVVVTKRADYIAKTTGNRSYPWRAVVIADKDTELLNSNTLYALASPSRIADTSWIKPGKVAWDWWHNCSLTGVDFRCGVNTQTYKYFIDFASKNGIEYIVLDEGWYDIRKTVLDIVPEIDLAELIRYGKEKNVGIILWMTWLALEEKMDEALPKFKEWGVKGLKIDFMQRDDQWMVEWYYNTAKRAAELQLLVDYHGSYKPTGITRTFPNMLTSEGVYGGEQNKWTDDLTPEHNVTLAFTRMACGPMDYTPGAMRNSKKGEFVERYYIPMSQGTRCHQLGMYVVFESPLQMLCDRPTNYEKEPDMMRFLGPVPTTWDETCALDAAVGDYIIMARRNGNKWWVGGMTDWSSRQKEITLDFLEEGKEYTMTLWEDGVNIHRDAEDYKMSTRKVRKGDKLNIKFAPGGGFAATIE